MRAPVTRAWLPAPLPRDAVAGGFGPPSQVADLLRRARGGQREVVTQKIQAQRLRLDSVPLPQRQVVKAQLQVLIHRVLRAHLPVQFVINHLIPGFTGIYTVDRTGEAVIAETNRELLLQEDRSARPLPIGGVIGPQNPLALRILPQLPDLRLALAVPGAVVSAERLRERGRAPLGVGEPDHERLVDAVRGPEKAPRAPRQAVLVSQAVSEGTLAERIQLRVGKVHTASGPNAAPAGAVPQRQARRSPNHRLITRLYHTTACLSSVRATDAARFFFRAGTYRQE